MFDAERKGKKSVEDEEMAVAAYHMDGVLCDDEELVASAMMSLFASRNEIS